MRLLLDTHLLLWAAGPSPRLSSLARRLIEDPDNELLASAASLWEIAIKSALRRPNSPLDASVFRRNLLNNGYQELAVTGEHAVAVASLPPLHRDPFDRMLVAQSIVEGIILLTSDPLVAHTTSVAGDGRRTRLRTRSRDVEGSLDQLAGVFRLRISCLLDPLQTRTRASGVGGAGSHASNEQQATGQNVTTGGAVNGHRAQYSPPAPGVRGNLADSSELYRLPHAQGSTVNKRDAGRVVICHSHSALRKRNPDDLRWNRDSSLLHHPTNETRVRGEPRLRSSE